MAKRATKDRGDTLIEVMFALVILGAILISSSIVAMRSLQLSQTAKERTQISNDAQRQLEALRGFRDNHTWDQFLSGNGSYTGVLNTAGGGCKVLPACYHMVLQPAGATTEYSPATGGMAATVASSYIEIGTQPDAASPHEWVDVTVYYGFDNVGGSVANSGHIKSRFTNLRSGTP